MKNSFIFICIFEHKYLRRMSKVIFIAPKIIVGCKCAAEYPRARIVGHNELPGVTKACPCMRSLRPVGSKRPPWGADKNGARFDGAKRQGGRLQKRKN